MASDSSSRPSRSAAAFLPIERPDQLEQRLEGLLDGHPILLAVVLRDDLLVVLLEVGA